MFLFQYCYIDHVDKSARQKDLECPQGAGAIKFVPKGFTKEFLNSKGKPGSQVIERQAKELNQDLIP